MKNWYKIASEQLDLFNKSIAEEPKARDQGIRLLERVTDALHRNWVLFKINNDLWAYNIKFKDQADNIAWLARNKKADGKALAMAKELKKDELKLNNMEEFWKLINPLGR